MIPTPDPVDLREQANEALLRRLTDDARRNGRRLAQLEFEGLCRDLDQPGALGLSVGFGNRGTAAGQMICTPSVSPASAQTLPVPLGRIAWAAAPETLPAIAIGIPDLPEARTAPLLRRLLAEHHRKPFARLLFLVQGYGPLALLGRYGFAVICCGTTAMETVAQDEAARFGLRELRSLHDASVLWRA